MKILKENFFFLENIGILILFRMRPITFVYIQLFPKNYDLKKETKKFQPQILLKFINQSFFQKNRSRTIKNRLLHWILKRISQFYSRNLGHTKLIFSFFIDYVSVNNKWTVIARKVIIFRKYRYFNSLSNATYPILTHRAVLEKLPFEKKVTKILTLNVTEIYGPIILPKELDRELSKIYLYKEFWSD